MKSDQKNKGILINLKVVLDKKNMTKKELAKKMNTSIGVVNRYYYNKIIMPNSNMICRMCRVLNCNISDLLTFKESNIEYENNKTSY